MALSPPFSVAPLYSPEDALLPLPPAHEHKTPETLRLEFELYAAVESLIAEGRGGFFKATIRMQDVSFRSELEFPYWGVIGVADVGALYPDRHDAFIRPLPPRGASEQMYVVQSESIWHHMMVAVPNPRLGGIVTRGIHTAVNMVVRLADTLTITADRLEERALALAAHMGETDRVLLEDQRRRELLVPEETRPRPWVPTTTTTATAVLPTARKPANRVAFEEKVQTVLDGLVRSERYIDRTHTVRVSSRVMQMEHWDMTEELRSATGSISTIHISEALIVGNTLEGIQLSLEMARGLRVSVGKLNEAVDHYFVPAMLAIAMSHHRRLGRGEEGESPRSSPLFQLDISTLQMIAMFYRQKSWVRQPLDVGEF